MPVCPQARQYNNINMSKFCGYKAHSLIESLEVLGVKAGQAESSYMAAMSLQQDVIDVISHNDDN